MKKFMLFTFLIVIFSAPLFSQWEKVIEFVRYGSGDIYFSDQENGMAVGHYYEGILRTADGGKTWNFENRIFYESFDKLFFANADTGMAVGEHNGLFITTDGGKTYMKELWNPPRSSDFSLGKFHMMSRNKFLSVGEYARIYLTTNGGQQWDTIQLSTYTNTLLDVTCVGTDTCYACGTVGLIAVSYDSGETWISQQLKLNNDLDELYFRNSKEGFVGGANGALIKTVDGGKTWVVLNTGCTDDIEEIYFFNADTGYLVSQSGDLLRTYNGGDTWEIYRTKYNMNPSIIYKACFIGSDTVFALTYAWIIKASLSQEFESLTHVRQDESEEFYLWPNPVHKTLHLEKLPDVGNIMVYDIHGNVVMHSYNKSTIDMGYLETGLYIIKIQTENKTISCKILKM